MVRKEDQQACWRAALSGHRYICVADLWGQARGVGCVGHCPGIVHDWADKHPGQNPVVYKHTPQGYVEHHRKVVEQ